MAASVLLYWLVSYSHIVYTYYVTSQVQRIDKGMLRVRDFLSLTNNSVGIYLSDELGESEFYRSMMFGYIMRDHKLYYSDSWYAGGYFNEIVRGSALSNIHDIGYVIESTAKKVIGGGDCVPIYRNNSFQIISIVSCGYIIPRSDVHMPENGFRWLGRKPSFLVISPSSTFVNIEILGVFPGLMNKGSSRVKVIFDQAAYDVALNDGSVSFSLPTTSGYIHNLTIDPDYEVTSPAVLLGSQDNRYLSYKLGHMSVSKKPFHELANHLE